MVRAGPGPAEPERRGPQPARGLPDGAGCRRAAERSGARQPAPGDRHRPPRRRALAADRRGGGSHDPGPGQQQRRSVAPRGISRFVHRCARPGHPRCASDVRSGRRPRRSAGGVAASGVQPRPAPALAAARERDAVVQAERAVLPELDRDGRDAEAGPVGRARDVAEARYRARGARPPSPARSGSRAGAIAGSPRRRSGCRAGGSRNRRPPRRRSPRHGAARADLAAQALPVQHERRLRLRGELAALARFGIGVEHEAVAASKPFSSTMRTSGRPSASTVASAMALGSFGSDRFGLRHPGREQRPRARPRRRSHRSLTSSTV